MNRYDAINQFNFTPESLAEVQAVQRAIDALKYGRHDPRAKEVEAQVRAEFRAKKTQVKVPNEDSAKSDQ